MPPLVVFDTCTRSQYYADMHQLLAMPSGTILLRSHVAQQLAHVGIQNFVLLDEDGFR